MAEAIHSPVDEYSKIYREKHAEVVDKYFDSLLKESGVDADANAETVRKYDSEMASYKDLSKKLRNFKGLRVFLIIMTVLLFVAGGIFIALFAMQTLPEIWALIVGIVCVLVAVGLILIICLVINKKIKILKTGADTHKISAEKLLQEAWAQMHPLNRLFNVDISTKLVQEAAPVFQFDPYFDAERLGLLATKYGLNDNLGPNRSVLCLKSGELAGSPFLLARILMHQMGQKTYTGSLTISWTETYRDSQGHTQYRTRTQTLTASVVKPYPEYYTSTKFIFGNEAAPDLKFSRVPKDLDNKSEKSLDRWVSKQEKQLDKKADKANFTKMTNTEFDVLFGAMDRNHDVQFRLLFTPLAQVEMVKIIKDNKIGYGDDFYFDKLGMLNLITPLHANSFDFTGATQNYTYYDLREIRRRFQNYNHEFFRQLFFSAAPIMAIPVYQDHKPLEKIYKGIYGGYLANWQHEAVANAFPVDYFRHPDSITNNVIKTQFVQKVDDGDLFNVFCSGFEGINRVDYVTKMGGDGRSHSIPVHWVEYIPVMETRQVVCKVDAKQKYNTQHLYKIFDRVMSYMKGNGISTAASYFAPSMYAFIPGDDVNRLAKTKLDEFLIEKDDK